MASLLFIFIALSIVSSFIIQRYTNKRNLRMPPGPHGLPFIGNLLLLDNSTPHRCLWQLSQRYGSLVSLRLGYVRILVVSSAKMAKEVLKAHDLVFSSRPPFVSQKTLSYNGIDVAFAAYNSCWRDMKKICVVHLFSSSRVQSFRPIREFEVCHMLEKISNLVVASKPIDLCNIVQSLTGTIICRIAFGNRSYEEGGIEISRFQALVKDVETLLTSFFVSDYFPFLSFVDKLTGLTSCLERNFNELDTFCEKLIQDHLDPGRSNLEQEDVLDILLQIWKDRSSKVQLTLNHIKAVLMNIFLGGTDSNGASVIWTMTYLMKNPVIMKKAQAEVRYVTGQRGFVHEDDIEQLSYLKAVVKETMRLQPPIPIIPRESLQHCSLDGYEIPAKTLVYVNLWAIGRDPEVWENPEEFCPERFVDTSKNDFRGQNFGLIPFGAGRRSCPGMLLALSTGELILANLLYKFDWEMPAGMNKDDIDMEVEPGITMNKKNALCLTAKNYI